MLRTVNIVISFKEGANYLFCDCFTEVIEPRKSVPSDIPVCKQVRIENAVRNRIHRKEST